MSAIAFWIKPPHSSTGSGSVQLLLLPRHQLLRSALSLEQRADLLKFTPAYETRYGGAPAAFAVEGDLLSSSICWLTVHLSPGCRQQVVLRERTSSAGIRLPLAVTADPRHFFAAVISRTSDEDGEALVLTQLFVYQ